MSCSSSTCDQLREAYNAILAQLTAMPVGTVSDRGRSISVQSAELKERLELIKKEAAINGCDGFPPVVTNPVFAVSRVRL